MKYLRYIVIGTALSFSACNPNEEKKEQKDAAPMMMKNDFTTITLQKSNPMVKLKLAGEIIADHEVPLYAKVNSYVKHLKVDIGSQVSEGQVLAVLEAPEIQAQLVAIKSRWAAQEAIYIATKANYDRMFKASETEGAISRDALDQITAKKLSDEAQLTAAKSAYDELKVMEDYLIIRAPFSGVVTERNVDLGAFVGPNGKGSDKPLLVVQTNGKLRLALSVPEANTPYLNVGDTIRFKVNALPQNDYFGKISRKSGALSLKLRSERIEADLINAANELKPLMVAEAIITLQGQTPTFFIPKTALVESNLGVYVIRIENNKTKKVPVAKGRVMPDKFEVFGALSEGDNILLKASEEMEEGMMVESSPKTSVH